jgi:competence protein ComEC
MHFLVDIGTKSTKSICKHLRDNHLNGKRLDYLILTHPHLDHINDLPNLYNYGITPYTLSRPSSAFPLVVGTDFTDAQKHIITKANELHEGYTSSVDWSVSPCNENHNGGVEISTFSPYSDNIDTNDLNTYSNVIVLEYAGFKVVLTGDNPKETLEKKLLRSDFKSAISNATVLLAPHHGRDSDFCESFVDAVNPRLVVFSDGLIKYSTQMYAAQKYGNKARGAKWGDEDRYVFTTRSDGNITFKFNADKSWNINTSTSDY